MKLVHVSRRDVHIGRASSPFRRVRFTSYKHSFGVFFIFAFSASDHEGFPSWEAHIDGPFAGEWKLRSFGVEYATAFKYEETSQEQDLTEMMWDLVKGYSSFLDTLWWKPWYCYNDWEGGMATLCHVLPNGNQTGEAPTGEGGCVTLAVMWSWL